MENDMPPKLKNLMKGFLLGDSLLLPYEFLYKPLGEWRFKKYGISQSLFRKKGVTSDDSDHFLLTYKALIESSNIIDFKKKLRKNLKAWLFTFSPNIGFTTLKSLWKLSLGWNDSGINSAGNGPLMRVPIIAYQFKDNEKERKEYIKSSTIITHNNKEAIAASQAIGNLISYLAIYSMLPNEDKLFTLLNDTEESIIWKEQLARLKSSFNLPQNEFLSTINCSKGVTGYIIHTTLYIIYNIYHNPDFKQSIKDIILAGGDTDTIGAIIGACYGLITEEEIQLENVYPHLSFENKNTLYKNFWKKIVLKNLLSYPIIYMHAILRVFYRFLYLIKIIY